VTEQQLARMAKRRLAVLRHAEEITGNVALTCRYYGISRQCFYAWLEDEGEIAADPMAKMKPPAIPEQPVPVLPDEALRRLFAACAGKDFEARRDTAMIMLLLDSGARRAELVGLCVEDLDFEHDVARVIGKGRRERALPLGRKTAVALDRYLPCRPPARRRGKGTSDAVPDAL
jgi:site-specific recombinase XerC